MPVLGVLLGVFDRNMANKCLFDSAPFVVDYVKKLV